MPAQATMQLLVSPDRIAYRIPDRDAFEALAKRLKLPGDPVAKNLRQLLGIQAVGLDGRTGSDCRHNWQLYGSVSWLEHKEYGLVPVVGDIDHRWGQVRQLDPSVERDAVKNLCNGKVKKTKGGWSYKGGGKIGSPPFSQRLKSRMARAWLSWRQELCCQRDMQKPSLASTSLSPPAPPLLLLSPRLPPS